MDSICFLSSSDQFLGCELQLRLTLFSIIHMLISSVMSSDIYHIVYMSNFLFLETIMKKKMLRVIYDYYIPKEVNCFSEMPFLDDLVCC